MSWNEFCSLLQGLGPETPLARTVQIRLETDKEVLKNFTSSQHKIRNKWRSRNVKHYSDEDMNTVLAEFQNFLQACKKKPLQTGWLFFCKILLAYIITVCAVFMPVFKESKMKGSGEYGDKGG